MEVVPKAEKDIWVDQKELIVKINNDRDKLKKFHK